MTLSPALIKFLRNTVHSFSLAVWTVSATGCAGSDRRFLRVKARERRESYILVLWDQKDPDWNRFISIQRDVSSQVRFLPNIYAYNEDLGCIVEEDLGDVTLKKYCEIRHATPAKIEDAYRRVLDSLVQWQRIEPCVSPVIASREMDLDMFLWESRYFATHCITEFFGCEKLLSDKWEKERLRIAREAAEPPTVCIHRDFQSENVMLRNRRIRFVDYQGARRGPAGYDVASLLYDPYVPALAPALSSRLFDYYRSIAPVDVTERSLRICALQRIMQALGAYGNLSIHKGKQRYAAFIPFALKRLAKIAGQGKDFPALEEIISACSNKLYER